MTYLYAESSDLEAMRPYLKDIKYIVEDCYGYLGLYAILVNLRFSVYRTPNRIRVVVPDKVIAIGRAYFLGARFNKSDSNAKAIYMRAIQCEGSDVLAFRIIPKNEDTIVAAEIEVVKSYYPFSPKNRILL